MRLVDRQPNMPGLFAPGNEIERRAVFRNVPQHWHNGRPSVVVKGFTPTHDITRREIEAAFVPTAFDNRVVIDAANGQCLLIPVGRRLEEWEL